MTDSSATAKAAPLTPDLCVIGAGRAGQALASAAAAFGTPVVLVARDGMGGPGRNLGDLPAAALVAAGTRMRAVAEAGRFGIGIGEAQVNFVKLHDHIARTSEALAPNASAERFGALGVQVIEGEARFRDRNSVVVDGQVIKARRFVIATGTRPVEEPFPELAGVPVLSEDDLPTLTSRPESLLVLGSDAAAVALAQAMQRLGSSVTLVSEQELLPGEDQEAVALMRRALLRDGVTLREGVRTLRAESIKGRARLVLAAADQAEETVEATHLLITRRRPDVAALELELAGIASDASGIIVDRRLRTANRRVYAIGACAGGEADGSRAPHAADHHARLVLRRILFRQPTRLGSAVVPRIVPGQPALASAGLSEAEATAKKREIQVLRWPYAENDHAQAERRTEGFVKLVADRKGGILGVTIVGAQAPELIAPWCLAIQRRLGIADMAGLVFPSQALSEISGRVALSHYAPLAAKPGPRRLIGFLRRFG